MGSVTSSKLVIAVTIALVAAWPAPAAAGDWFVAPNGRGDGSRERPFGSIQQALDVALPGDIVRVHGGTYTESLQTVRDGVEGAPITVFAENGPGTVLVTARGKVLFANHAFQVFDGLSFDGQYGGNDILDIENNATFFILRNAEVQRSGVDCVDINGPVGVLIENTRVHHCLRRNAQGRQDAHAITAGHVRKLTIRNSEMHTFSGDGFQMDPDREREGWDEVLIEGCRIWLEPLPEDVQGFPAGTVPGENAVDLKAHNRAARGTITIRDTLAWGFRKGLITNMAAFNLKENTRAIVDRVTVWDSEIAFRVRGGTGSSPQGTWTTVTNAVVYDVTFAVRYEDRLENFRILNSTFGSGIGQWFRAADTTATLDIQNLAVFGPTLPRLATAPSNMALPASAFVDAAAHDYHLVPGALAVDAGASLIEVESDRDGVGRPQGSRHDIGAYEFCQSGCGQAGPAPAELRRGGR